MMKSPAHSRKGATICLVPRLSGVGGMVSFQQKLAYGLTARQFQVTFDLKAGDYDAVLVIGGTRHLDGLGHARRKGIPIIQRLDGMNWLHRVPLSSGRRRTSLRHFLRAETGNWLLSTIRARLANRIVYQSRFSQAWWEQARGLVRASGTVIYNGVDLERYTPSGPGAPPQDCWRVLMVEGSLMGGYELGLEAATGLARAVSARLPASQRREGVELMVVGRTAPDVQAKWTRRMEEYPAVNLVWHGLVPSDRIPEIDRSAHLLYSADINAACPNSVIEAMACGLPVAAFDTGALPELVQAGSGQVVSYGGNPWRLDPPDVQSLAEASLQILFDQNTYRTGARQRAEQEFGLDAMTDAYLQVLLG